METLEAGFVKTAVIQSLLMRKICLPVYILLNHRVKSRYWHSNPYMMR